MSENGAKDRNDLGPCSRNGQTCPSPNECSHRLHPGVWRPLTLQCGGLDPSIPEVIRGFVNAEF